MPRGGRGVIIMFHDGGGNREQTVAALPAIITKLKAEGYQVTTITGGLRLPAGDAPATASQRFAGTALVLIQQAADHAVALLAVVLVAASVLTVIRLSVLVGFARRTGAGPVAPGPAGPCAVTLATWRTSRC